MSVAPHTVCLSHTNTQFILGYTQVLYISSSSLQEDRATQAATKKEHNGNEREKKVQIDTCRLFEITVNVMQHLQSLGTGRGGRRSLGGRRWPPVAAGWGRKKGSMWWKGRRQNVFFSFPFFKGMQTNLHEVRVRQRRRVIQFSSRARGGS